MGPHQVSRRALARIGFAVLLTVALSAGCRDKETPEAKIRKVLDAGVAALEARDVDAAAATLSEDYGDKKGRTRKQLKQLAFIALQQGPVLVSMQSVDIQPNGDNAEVKLKVLAVQGSAELKTAADLLPTNARAFDLTVRMTKDDGDWKVAAIEGLGGGGWD